MKIFEVSAADYSRAFPHPAVVYNSVAFTELNAAKVNRVRRIIIAGDNDAPVLGLTIGESDGDGAMRAPFSAPFACFDSNREHGSSVMLEAAGLLRSEYIGLRLTLPPEFYAGTKQFLSLMASGASLEYLDWNYHLDLSRPIIDGFSSAARNKLRQAERSGLRLEKCTIERAYEIIRINRSNRGYYLAMTLDQVIATADKGGPVRGDFFVLTDGNTDAAAAIVFHVAAGIAQVIYWGDIPYEGCRQPMNLLAARLAEHYAGRGLRILDIGPSGSDGIPSPGLSDFKDSIGCIVTAKPTLRL